MADEKDLTSEEQFAVAKATAETISPHVKRVAVALEVCGTALDSFHGIGSESGSEWAEGSRFKVAATTEYFTCVAAYAQLLALSGEGVINTVLSDLLNSPNAPKIAKADRVSVD